MAVALATAAISIASAQRSFNTTMEGRGTARFGGQSYSFNQLQLTLQENKRVTVHALLRNMQSKDLVFTGRLNNSSRRSGRLNADIDNVAYGANADSADALCDIDMSSNSQFRTVTITGRNTSDRNRVALDFVSNGREVTSYQPPRGAMGDEQKRRQDQDRDRDRNRNRDRDRDKNDNRWPNGGNRSSAQGRYTETEAWRNNGQHFVMRYTLELSRNGDARLVADSLEDRNMPNNSEDRYDHGDILKYMHSDHTVTETGHWTQDGDRVTIKFDRISYGSTRRDKKEVWKGRLRNDSLRIDDFEKSFYGHKVELTFARN